MNNQEIAESLMELVKLFSDTAWNYERALDQIQDEDLRLELSELHNEHIGNMENLNSYIRQLGEKTPAYEFSGEMSSELKAITSEMPDDEVIRTLRKNEKVINEKLSSVVEDVQIPELTHELEEEIENEKIYIDTLENLM
ncbi:MAG: hypothetical protein GX556_09660 [Fibrobacter sp.]|nr:hypothetical protein [Fibrobacter sp.]